MTWLDHHHRSTELAAAARKSVRLGDESRAERLYEKAATEAERALALVAREKRVTFGVIAMLAHRLWRSARRSDDAARVAELIRGSPELFPITVNLLDGGGRAPIFSARDRARRSGEPTKSALVSEEEELCS